MPQSEPSIRRSGPSRILALLALATIPLLILLGILEITFRLFPALLPHGAYGASRFDPKLGLSVHAGRIIYHKVRLVVRDTNRDGFPDVAHEEAKPAGTLRVGIFGDSYVEAAQVPLEQTFFRRIPEKIAGRPIETLAFGLSGTGTLYARLNCAVQCPRYDLDLVIHPFVKNDAGDNMLRVRIGRGAQRRRDPVAVPAAGEPGYSIQWVGASVSPPLLEGAAKALQTRLLLPQVILSRWSLLRQQDIGRGAARASGTARRWIPDPNDLPSAWDPDALSEARTLTYRILAHWRDELRSQGRDLLLLYVPRGTVELEGELAVEDTWYPWLDEVCSELGIPMLDPRPALIARMRAGDPVYDDHWSPAGHEVIAELLTDAIARYARMPPRGS